MFELEVMLNGIDRAIDALKYANLADERAEVERRARGRKQLDGFLKIDD
jgi:hypothetical protein